METGPDGAALDDGQLLKRAFDAEVAACHHQTVAGLDDLIQIGDGRLVLDLGDDAGAGIAAAQEFPEVFDVR